jgi:hypothetical protein
MLACLRGDDQKLNRGQLPLQAEQPTLVMRLDHLMHDGRCGDEASFDAALASSKAEPGGDMGLAHAGGAEGDDVLPAGDELPAGQVEDQLLVEGGDRIEVKAFQALDRRETGGLDAPVDHPGFSVQKLQLDHPAPTLMAGIERRCRKIHAGYPVNAKPIPNRCALCSPQDRRLPG